MQFDELPDAARTRVIGWAAAALGSAAPDRIPPGLAAVARFTPAKRATRGAGPLARALESDAAFRALVAHTARSAADADAPADDVRRVALAFLASTDVPEESLVRLRDTQRSAAAARRIAALEREVARLGRLRTGPNDVDRGGPGESTPAPAGGAPDEVADRLRRRLREQGTRLREAEDRAAEAVADRDRMVAAARRDVEIAERNRDLADRRAEQAADHAERAARAAGAQRDSQDRAQGARDRRIELLLDTAASAVAGVRREWRPVSRGELPADVVARQLAPVPVAAPGVADAGRLTELLTQPGTHLVVDGYNVTKTGYPDLSLADQRDRLIRSLSGLAARTSAEITVVFDGAAVATAPPQGRKIRVLFSPPGIIADDVIRRLVAAEPGGRPLVVATSDRAVVTDVARAGARTVASGVLLGVLAR